MGHRRRCPPRRLRPGQVPRRHPAHDGHPPSGRRSRTYEGYGTSHEGPVGRRGITNQDQALRQASGEAFYNTSPFRLRDLTSRGQSQRLRADFEAYLDGFSPNVQEVLDKFKFRNQIPTLVEADALGFLLEKFLDSSINLSPKPILKGDASVRLEGLDNHGMGTVFEELIRRFNEENNEEAGEHFTPRDVVQLMARPRLPARRR